MGTTAIQCENWCQTYTGRAFWLQDPRPEDVCAEDIAHALGNLCRFGGHSKWFYCPTPDQRILTADLRWLPAGDLKVGDELVGFDENPNEAGSTGKNRRRYRHCVVTHAQPVRAEVWQLTMEDGSTVTTSAEHPWLVATKNSGNQAWRTVAQLSKDLSEGRKRYMHKFMEPWRSGSLWEDGWLAGLYDGEGYISFSGRTGIQMGVSQRPGLVLDQAARLLSARNFPTPRITGTGDRDVLSLQLIGGWREMARLLGTVRPVRLLDKFLTGFRNGQLSKQFDSSGSPSEIKEATYLGQQWVAGLETSTHTYLCEGYAAHNSVAEHSIHVSRIVPTALALRALLHDASEAYVVDVPRPLKQLLTGYAAIEHKIQGAVYQRFGVPFAYSPVAPELDVIKWADNTMLHTEALAMMATPPQPWQTLPPPLPEFRFSYLGPVRAERAFLARLEELTR